MKNILITSSLANDMIQPVSREDNLPHRLHIGYLEAVRLLGEDWKTGPLMSFLKWCEQAPERDLSIVHVRDWHDYADPLQKQELEKFGPHCMAGTKGAEFIWEKEGILGSGANKPCVVNSKKIMAATEPEFTSLLEQLIGEAPHDEVKIGIIGLLTNIKVQQMAIALQGHPYFLTNIAVCPALTASNNYRKHSEALDDLANYYGVAVIDSISEFSDWLSLKTKPPMTAAKFDVPKIHANSEMSREQRDVVEYLYRDCKWASLTDLTGGFSGSKLFLAQSTDRAGFEQVPTVVKIDSRAKIAKERKGYEKVQHILGPHVPRIIDSVESDEGAGIKYSFAMMNRTDMPTTFKSFFRELDGTKAEDMQKLENGLALLYNEILRPMAANSNLNGVQLWAANSFCQKYAEHTIQSMNRTLGTESKADTIRIAGIELFNPARFYAPENIDKKLHEPVAYVRTGLAHGDLNAANILADSVLNLFILDFFHTSYDWHAVQDIVKLENDLKFIHTPISSEDELRQAIGLEKLLASQEKLSDELPELSVQLAANPNFKRVYTAVKMLRRFAYGISQDPEMKHYRIPQLRYSAHNLSFAESNEFQKKLALASTAMHCEYLM